jgi:hypothetical protein
MFRVLKFIHCANPELYESLKDAIDPHKTTEWAKIVRSHTVQLERSK